MTTPDKDWLDEPVIIHFKENSIPGLRRGVLTEEAKAAINKYFLDLIGEDESTDNMLRPAIVEAKNELRAELRNKLEGR